MIVFLKEILNSNIFKDTKLKNNLQDFKFKSENL